MLEWKLPYPISLESSIDRQEKTAAVLTLLQRVLIVAVGDPTKHMSAHKIPRRVGMSHSFSVPNSKIS